MIIVRVSSKGQIAIPKTIREQIGLTEGTDLAISVENQDLIMRKVSIGSWRRWRGVLKGSGALQEHEQEHREELRRDAQSPRCMGDDGVVAG